MAEPSNSIDKNYVSPYDEFLNNLRQEIPESESQQKEHRKHADIARKRDYVEESQKPLPKKIWTAFNTL